MKELSIEEKAKRYDEAIEQLRTMMPNWESLSYNGKTFLQDLVHIIPELKESGGERMIKFIKQQLFNIKKTITENYELDAKLTKAIAWLEKQGEQKPADKVEQKFKVGDWVVYDHRTYQIVELPQGRLINASLSRNGKTEQVPLPYCEKWSIQDAKNGDVLSYVTDKEDLWIMIYWSLYKPYEGHVHYHAILVNNNFSDKGTCCVCIDDLKPATKKQRDLLFQKMKEAGYEWDAEKKELKKIEQKPCMIQWKGDNLKEVIGFTGKDKNFDKWFKSFAEYEKYVSEHDNVFKLFNADGSHFEIPVGAWIIKTPDGYNVASKAIFKNKPAWSEEDEAWLNDIINDAEQGAKLDSQQIDWLKSLKDRVGCEVNCITTKEWSKEDENHVKSILSTIEYCKSQVPNAQAVVESYNADIEWLKSLRPQNKNTSKEFEDVIREIKTRIAQCNGFNRKHREEVFSLLDTIRPQSQWKPSDEQLNAIRVAIGDEQGSDCCGALRDLLKDLKSL